MQSLRSWTVHVPGHPDELELLLRHAHRTGQRTYIRMTTDVNPTSYTRIPGRLVTLRRGSIDAPTVLAVGPAAGPTLNAVADIDATVLYTSTPHPLDTTGLRAAVLGSEIVVVEPYLSGTSTAQVAEALTDRPMIIRAHGITNVDLRRYGTPDEHRSVHGLDASGIRAFLDRAPEPVG